MTLPLRTLVLTAPLALAPLAGCDLDLKDIGREPTGSDSDGPTACTPGEERPADDGCNDCECDENSQWACTLRGCGGTCTPGEVVDQDCNTCVCQGDGTWSCTDIACPPPAGTDHLYALEICNSPSDPITVQDAALEGSVLTVRVFHGGGCEEHTYGGCWDGLFRESYPVQAPIFVAHDANGDACGAGVFLDLQIDLAPLADAFETTYPDSEHVIVVPLAGWNDEIVFTW